MKYPVYWQLFRKTRQRDCQKVLPNQNYKIQRDPEGVVFRWGKTIPIFLYQGYWAPVQESSCWQPLDISRHHTFWILTFNSSRKDCSMILVLTYKSNIFKYSCLRVCVRGRKKQVTKSYADVLSLLQGLEMEQLVKACDEISVKWYSA